MTPAQLDAIATKLLGWKRVFIDRSNAHLFPITHTHGDFWQRPDGELVDWGLSQKSPADAMLVLEAMGEWCADNGMRVEINCPAYNIGFAKTKPANCSIHLWEVSPDGTGAKTWWVESADTPAAAIFQCAAKLVGRM